MEVRKYLKENGVAPFDEWMAQLRNHQAKTRVLARIRRLGCGLEGDWKSVGEGVRELRIPEGPGYRIYYAWDGPNLILLLISAGDKGTQKQDIETAKHYWRNYHERESH
jgi:putative addiction module killer protein